MGGCSRCGFFSLQLRPNCDVVHFILLKISLHRMNLERMFSNRLSSLDLFFPRWYEIQWIYRILRIYIFGISFSSDTTLYKCDRIEIYIINRLISSTSAKNIPFEHICWNVIWLLSIAILNPFWLIGRYAFEI